MAGQGCLFYTDIQEQLLLDMAAEAPLPLTQEDLRFGAFHYSDAPYAPAAEVVARNPGGASLFGAMHSIRKMLP